MFIPEILEHLEGADLEDWLTLAFIERQHQLPVEHLCSNGGYRSTEGMPDIWMVEVTNRLGKQWSGRFNIEFLEEQRNGNQAVAKVERKSGEMLFTLDTETAKVTFKEKNSPV
jgi:hypothetical protein